MEGSFDSFDKLKWFKISGEKFGTFDELRQRIKNSLLEDFYESDGEISYDIHIGTDSQNKGRSTKFVTVVVMHKVGRGAFGFFTSYTVPRMKSLNQRLFTESQRSIEFAFGLQDIFDEFSIIPKVHADVNPDRKHKSSAIVDEVVSYIEQQGYIAIIKPHSYVSSHCADHLVKA